MNVEKVAQPSNMRAIPWAIWALLLLAAALFAYQVMESGYSLIGALLTCAPIVFASAVIYVKAVDRRFTWAALALAASPVIGLIWSVLPEAVFKYAPGAWPNAAFLLQDMSPIAGDVASVLTIVGIGLLGLALGGVRTRLSAAILGVGVVVALVHAILVTDSFSAINFPPGDSTLMITLARGILVSTLTVVGWAFVFAAALESRRKLMPIGTGLIFAITVVNYLTVFWETLLNNGWGVLLTAIAAVHLVGWALLIVAVLRGELNAAPLRKGGDLRVAPAAEAPLHEGHARQR